MDIQAGLDRVFHPKVLAVVGAKQDNDYMWLHAHGPFTEFGKIYHVNIDEREWPGAEELGFPNVASLLDIPEPVDYVAISVPSTVVPAVLRDCAAKGVGGAHIFAAGFAETGTDMGQQLEEAVRNIATEGDFLVIGPNCMGLYNPALGIRPGRDLPHGGSGGVLQLSLAEWHHLDEHRVGRPGQRHRSVEGRQLRQRHRRGRDRLPALLRRRRCDRGDRHVPRGRERRLGVLRRAARRGRPQAGARLEGGQHLRVGPRGLRTHAQRGRPGRALGRDADGVRRDQGVEHRGDAGDGDGAALRGRSGLRRRR